MQGLPGFLTSTPLGRCETLKVSLKNPKGVAQDRTQDQTRDLRSDTDNQWFNQVSYLATYIYYINMIDGLTCVKCVEIRSPLSQD
jgi:hypothetical protein